MNEGNIKFVPTHKENKFEIRLRLFDYSPDFFSWDEIYYLLDTEENKETIEKLLKEVDVDFIKGRFMIDRADDIKIDYIKYYDKDGKQYEVEYDFMED